MRNALELEFPKAFEEDSDDERDGTKGPCYEKKTT